MKDERLAEIRKEVETGKYSRYPYWARTDMKCLLDHIAELERLVPDADFLKKLDRFFFGDATAGVGYTGFMRARNELEVEFHEVIDAIREYRRKHDDCT